MPTTDSDKELMAAIAADREAGFRRLLRSYQEPVYWHIRRITVGHADAEDAMQETFMRVFRGLGRYRREMPLSAWIYRIATNEALRQRNRRRSEEPLDDGGGEDGAPGPAALLPADSYCDYSDLEAVRLQRAILSLPPKQQLAFNLRYYDEFDYDRIAQVMDTTAAAAKANYHIAKEKIINYISTHD